MNVFRKYLGIFPAFGGLILLFSIIFPAAVYDKYSGNYLEIMISGWFYKEGIWDYGIYSGYLSNNLVLWLGKVWSVGLIISGITIVVGGLYFIYKLYVEALNFKFYKILEIICGIIVIILPILWMIAVDSFFSTNDYVYIEAGVSFLRDLKPTGPTFCSFVIGPINIIISILIPSGRSQLFTCYLTKSDSL